MVVRTAATSEKAAEGQNATLEFILVNHPLDCPVCDKGGECPLQDLTFRYGPGNTRMTFPKITLEKPIPVSPLIALDRERCILCYRCTRFSSDVAEDNQLVARNRGAHTEIATFESDPYRAPFSGNVIELCPVGALTSTQYRFEARPWDIQNVPTVCGLCPVGCNVNATVREGKVKRILSRNHPEIDEGWLCDKGRFSYPHLTAEDRITEPLARGPLGLEPLAWDAALDRAEELLREAGTNIVTALSGTETIEQAYALGRLLRGGLGAHAAVLPEVDLRRAERVPAAALGAREGRARGRRRRRRGRGARAGRRPVAEGGATERRRDRPLRPHRQRAVGSRAAPLPPCRRWPSPATSSAGGCGHPTARSSSGRAAAVAAERGSPRPRTRSASRGSPAAAPSISPRPRMPAASPSRGPPPPTRTRRIPSRSGSSSSRATRRPPTRPCVPSRSAPST